MKTERDNLKAGLFVVFGTALMILAVFLVADLDSFLSKNQTVRVYFPLGEGLQGLKAGATVTLGDQPVGEVEKISDVIQDNRAVGSLVHVILPQKYQLYWDARVELVPELIGGGTKLNVRSVGTTNPYSPGSSVPTTAEDRDPNAPKDALVGGLASSSLTKSFGIGDEQRGQIASIIGNIDRFTRALAHQDTGQDVPVKALITDLKSTVEEANRFMKKLSKLAGNADDGVSDVRAVIADAGATVKEVRGVTTKFGERFPAWAKRADETADATAETVNMVRDLVKTNGDKLTRTVNNAEQLTKVLREKTLKQVETALAKANAAVENVHDTTSELKGLVVGQRPVLERAFANAQLMSDQLKLAAIEIRRSPWRLLHQPGDKELETDNLYDAARSFALAAGTLDSAAKSLQSVSAGSPDDDVQLKRMLDRLEILFEKFEGAEQDFWKALRNRPKK